MIPDDAGDGGDVDQPPNAERQPEQDSDANRQQEQADDKEEQQPNAAPRAPEVEPVDPEKLQKKPDPVGSTDGLPITLEDQR